MQELRGIRTIDIGLGGTIQFQQTNDAIGCVIHDITEDFTEAMVIAPDPRVCAREDVELRILLPTERSPVKCTGRITWYSEDEELFKGRKGYLARILITHISRMDRRRLELVIERKIAFMSGGRG